MSGDLGTFRRDTIFSINESDNYADELLRQVIALEAVIVARWPGSIAARWRLARELRRSVAHIEGATFTEKRLNTIGSGWLERRRS